MVYATTEHQIPTGLGFSTRHGFIDSIKTLAIFLVVFYHLSGSHVQSTIDYLIISIASMGVPLFFAVNGFLILSKNVDPRKHILKTIRLYILTICWSFITVLSLILINGDKYSII